MDDDDLSSVDNDISLASCVDSETSSSADDLSSNESLLGSLGVVQQLCQGTDVVAVLKELQALLDDSL